MVCSVMREIDCFEVEGAGRSVRSCLPIESRVGVSMECRSFHKVKGPRAKPEIMALR